MGEETTKKMRELKLNRLLLFLILIISTERKKKETKPSLG